MVCVSLCGGGSLCIVCMSLCGVGICVWYGVCVWCGSVCDVGICVWCGGLQCDGVCVVWRSVCGVGICVWSSKPGGPQGRGPAGPESTVKGGWVESETRASFVPTYTLGWQKPSQGGGRPCPESAGGVGEEGGHPSASGLSIQPPTPEGTTPPTLGSPPCRMSPLNSSPQASSGGHPALS